MSFCGKVLENWRKKNEKEKALLARYCKGSANTDHKDPFPGLNIGCHFLFFERDFFKDLWIVRG